MNITSFCCYSQLHSVIADDLAYAKPMGRPPAARDLGVDSKTSEWPRFTFTSPPGLRETITAISTLESRPAWRIIADAIALYVRSMPPEDRRLVDGIATRSKAKAVK